MFGALGISPRATAGLQDFGYSLPDFGLDIALPGAHTSSASRKVAVQPQKAVQKQKVDRRKNGETIQLLPGSTSGVCAGP